MFQGSQWSEKAIVSSLQDTSDLATGSANGYVTGQIYYDAFNVRILLPLVPSLHDSDSIALQKLLRGCKTSVTVRLRRPEKMDSSQAFLRFSHHSRGGPWRRLCNAAPA